MNQTGNSSTPVSPWPTRMGWALNIFLALSVLMGGVTDVLKLQFVIDGLTKAGFDERIIVPMGVVSIVIALLYVFPRTSVLGAILLTGYFGGAVATHVHQIGHANGDPVYGPMSMAITFGVLVWVALYLRMPRLRTLAPIVK